MKKTILYMGFPAFIVFLLGFYISTTNIYPLFDHSDTKVMKVQSDLQTKKLPLRIVALGDSLTQGVGDKNKEGYAGYTTDKLKEQTKYSSVTLNNYGVTGYTTDDLLTKVLPRKDVLQHIQKANLIFMTIGGNDLLHVIQNHFLDLKMSYFVTQNKHYQKNLNKILTILKQNNSHATIYYLGMYNPFQDYFNNIQQFNRIVQSWNKDTRTILSHYPDTVYVPTYDLFAGKDRELISTQDHLHPNAEGYHLMTNRLYQYIQKQGN